jgi:hypothetical protein
MTELDQAINLLEHASTTAGLRPADMRRMMRDALLLLYKHRKDGVLDANRAYGRGREDEKNKVGGMQI